MTNTVLEFNQKEAVQSKKEMILSLFQNGTTEIESIAAYVRSLGAK